MPETYKNNVSAQIGNLWKLIGNTPFIAVSYRFKGGPEQQVLVKCEQYNMTGSIKDRMALYILQKASEQGKIRPGDMIVEATSGNTGIAFAAIGKAIGNRVRIIMPDWMSLERKAIIKSYGAEVKLVSKEEGGFLGSIAMAEAMSHYDGVFLPRQFANRYNVEAHEKTTGREIGHSLLLEEIKPAAFVAGVGTGGTVMGVGNFLRSLFPEMKVHPLEPAESPTLSAKYKAGSHRIQGISDEFIPDILDLNNLDQVLQVNDGEAILMAQKITKELGMSVGISSGANLAAAIRLQQQLGTNKAVVTIFPDNNKKYLSTDLFKEEPFREGYLTKDVQLIAHRVLNKV
ncbi:PLP-dependent cysteine synthase family protein [Mucilaginibacter sp. BJC16-A38]|uniref:PLP-dependent cysteine synthase family protein n=1 Tax=Mucilaginibacter phenanthrenivorans TaxID=1234842 RepID=UPI00215746CD|nr:PLP-dependent cysteine synthase family protein [Mucilaginibacter phenanthrenivorans]MCR8556957.1 PLP-dependent cysteine synthase family protein [Mucilaginibacter phenanthrenivorans]